jgi:hypothetical protein
MRAFQALQDSFAGPACLSPALSSFLDFPRTASVAAILFVLAGLPSAFGIEPTPPIADSEASLRIHNEYLEYNPRYDEERAARITRTHPLLLRDRELEAAGRPTDGAKQILWELKALLTQTADFGLIDRRLSDLELLLANPDGPDGQDPIDGSWGRHYTEWYCKLDATLDQLGTAYWKSRTPPIPLRFLDRVNSPELLTRYLSSVSVSDVARTGVDHLLEFNIALGDLMRLILRDRPSGYPWDPGLKSCLKDLIFSRFRNPSTGWWGERYVRGGQTVFVDDLSTTFHVVSYLDGKVPDLPRVIDTTLAVRDLDYPVGWRFKGEYWNHNNMDVVALFKAGWAQASADQRDAMAGEIAKMLQWCLTQSLQSDGMFKPNSGDGSLEEGTYYGASFLARIGYFDKADRFWTNREFPEAEAVRQRIAGFIIKHLGSGGSGGGYYEDALSECLKVEAPKG